MKTEAAPFHGQEKGCPGGFSLIEVVIAVGLVAVAIPTLLGMFGYFSEISVTVRDRDDIEAVAGAVQVFLETGAGKDAGSGALPAAGTFAAVYDWVYKARQDPDRATVVYAYHHRGKDAVYTVSTVPPGEDEISLLDGRIMAVEIHPPGERMLPSSSLDANVSNYRKAYLPLELEIFALSTAEETRSPANFIDSLPTVLFR